MIHPVIMAGGTGSRLWPLSRQLNPKQFLKLTDQHLSMLQLTVARLDGMESADPLLICNEDHRFLAAEQMRQAGYKDARIILEPCGRNTAPAIALAALQLVKNIDENQNPLMLVLAADHLIKDIAAFQSGIQKAIPLAQQDKLVTFGIVPGHAETGYGYIQQGPKLADDSFSVSRFVEKPDQTTAEEYLASGDYLWNSGMFLFGARTYLQELQKHRPDILAICQAALDDASEDLHFTRVNESVFAECPEDSIDYAVMEKTDNAAVVALDAGWSDIGSWSALWEVSEKDSCGNAFSGDVIAHNTESTLVRADSRLVATVGVKDLVIIETKDALLVAHKDQVQDVKKVVERIK
ncbi:MAG TPA: mannose-1-phosphate guanylyltransferase/mannose-6-phosphate isomerase, partial [Marinobacter hydrocarbonoclasticus]|nr:mannose-1-phosphate guanylyltransferase/mannose-6-phosphate isomerase [Marinobacter nauticus]